MLYWGRIPCEEAYRLINTEHGQLVDVCSPSEYKMSGLPAAINKSLQIIYTPAERTMNEKTPDLFSNQDPKYDLFADFIDTFADFLRNIIVSYDLDSIDEGQEVTHPELQTTLSCVRLTRIIESNAIIETRIIRGASFAPVTLGVASDHFYELVTIRNRQTNAIIDRKLHIIEVDPEKPAPSFQSH